MKPCSIPGCSKPASSKATGWCKMHYTRWKRHGDPNIKNPPNRLRPDAEILAQFIPNRPAGGCWEWQGSRNASNYGLVSRWPKKMLAHRFVYTVMVGPLSADQVLMHSCDNPPCVNPAHLTPGTDADNMRDCVSKGRHARGERQGGAKLGPDDVMQIRERIAGGESYESIGRDFPMVTISTLGQIAHGRTWKHLPVMNTPEGKWTAPGPCRECGRGLRPSRSSITDYPNTVMHAGHGLCGRCKNNLNATNSLEGAQ